jgi:organic radical activating enzyme
MQNFDRPAENFCMAPWTNIHVGTLENLQPCCAGAGINSDIEQLRIYTSDKNQDLLEIKKHFLQNQEPPNCKGCQERNWYSQFNDQAPTGLNDFTLRSVDLRWSNTCQLTCMYCNAAQSSAWAALEQKHSTTIPIASRIRSRSALIDFIQQHKSTIQRVSLLGGEPLLIKENIRLLKMLDSDIEVNIFSGLNVDLETNAVYQLLIDMPNVFWTVSMENVGAKFEFVRRGSSWARQVENIDRLISDKQSRYVVNLQSQFCAYSATSVTDLYAFVRERDIKIHWNWLDGPKVLDFSYFPDHHKSMALEQLLSVKSAPNKFFYSPQVDHIIDRINATLGNGNQEQVSKCRQWHRDIESRYFENQLDFVSLWPEFAN